MHTCLAVVEIVNKCQIFIFISHIIIIIIIRLQMGY
jgi:hypothetical protein